MRGTIDRLWNNDREDGSKYWVLSIDGQRYSTHDADLVRDVQPGDNVEFSFTTSGRFRNLVSLKKL